MSKAIKDTLWVAAANGMLLVMRILMLPYLVRTLSKTEYGTYGQVLLVVELLIGILCLGVARGIYVVYATKQFDRQATFRTAFTALLAVGLVGYGAVVLFRSSIAAQFGNPALAPYLPMYGLTIVIQVPATVLTATLLYFERPRRTVLATVMQTVVALSVLFVGITLGDLRIAFWGLTGAAAVQFVFLWFSLKGIAGLGFQWDPMIIRALYRASWGTALAACFLFAANRGNEMIAGLLLPIETYALFRAGGFELPFFTTLYASVSTVLAPRLTQLYQQGEYGQVVALKRRGIAGTAYLVFPVYIFLVFFGPFLIGKYLGDRYQASAYVFVIYNAILLFRVTEYNDVLQASQRQRYILWVNALYSMFAVSAGLLAIRYIGIYAGAAAHPISFTVFVAMQLLLYQRLLGARLGRFFDRRALLGAMLVSIGLVLPLWAVFQMHTRVWVGLACGAAYGLLYLILTIRLRLVDPGLVEILLRLIPFLRRFVLKWYPETSVASRGT